MEIEVLFTRTDSVAARIEELIRQGRTGIDAALYRLDLPRLAQALAEAARRGLRVRLVLDSLKYSENQATRELLAKSGVRFRLAHGRRGPQTKMHHKFAVLDHETVLTGSYNWTLESEQQNYENLVILRSAEHAAAYSREFEALWAAAPNA